MTIPVTANPNGMFSCGTAPYAFFQDALTEYSSATVLSSSTTGGGWLVPANSSAGGLVSQGAPGLAIPQGTPNIFSGCTGVQVPGSKPFYSAKATFAYSSVGGYQLADSIGFSDDCNETSGHIAICQLGPNVGYNGSPTGVTFNYAAGSGAFSPTTNVFGTPVLSSPITMQCDLKITGSSMVMVGRVTSGGTTTTFTSGTFAYPFSASAPLYGVLIGTQGGAGTASGAITNVTFSAADAAQ